MARKIPSVMGNRFSRVPDAQIQRSSFQRNSGHKTTLDAGYLVPVFCDEALPGDTFNLRMAAFGRLATPLHPFMDNVVLESFFFFVPNRLLWENWERFNGSQDNPGDSTSYLMPTMSPAVASGGYSELSLEDYFGLPIGVENLTHRADFHRAYNLIWNEWFRDENLQDSLPVPLDDGPDDPANYTLMRRGKRHDYFTSCLPWPQKGPSVMLPLGDTAPIVETGAFTIDDPLGSNPRALQQNLFSGGYVVSTGTADVISPLHYSSGLETDLASATAATVNSLRQAFQIQRLYERDARGGTRYIEIVRSHFGVTSPDARLQRPEYLGGGRSVININAIAQTSASVLDRSGQGGDVAETPQGNLAAIGTVAAQGHGFTSSFTEHGVILGFVSIRADLNYQQNLDRMWSRSTRWDFYWPSLAHIGEQAVLSKELFCDGTAGDEDVFGYQERFAEYRYKASKITGRFRSNSAVPLDTWHLAQDFGVTRPVLGDTFIQENPPIDRVIAVVDEPHFLLDTYAQLKCARPMPMYSVPGMIDHF